MTMTASNVTQLRPAGLFTRLADAGYGDFILPAIPPRAKLSATSKITPGNTGKIPGQLLDDGWAGLPDWPDKKMNPGALARYDAIADAGISIRTGKVVGIDIDVTASGLADAIEGAAVDFLGLAPKRTGRAPKRLLVYRTATRFTKATIVLKKGREKHLVELLGEGNQFIAYGTHPKTQRPYDWGRDDLLAVPFDNLTEITRDDLLAFVGEVERIATGKGYTVTRKGGGSGERSEEPGKVLSGASLEQSRGRGIQYLQNEAPVSIEGEEGDKTLFTVMCKLKTMGIPQGMRTELYAEHLNPRCEPPWSIEEIQEKDRNAEKYSQGALAEDSVAVQFASDNSAPAPVPKTKNYLEAMNDKHAVVFVGAKYNILHEATDYAGRPKVDFLERGTFREMYATKTVLPDGAKRPVTWAEQWLGWEKRRVYNGICFLPERQPLNGYYNTWGGFSVKPWPKDVQPTKDAGAGVAAWLEHAERNVCQGNHKLYLWLISYFAHMIQRPWEKPQTALAFRGGKGVGKNALIERFGYLLGDSFTVVSDERYLLSNFNSLLERCLFFVLDEAVWAGNKQAEGKMKDLITGKRIPIERKGWEPYKIDNLVRLAVIGNENWLIPASDDERRYACFYVGDARKQDRAFFRAMQENLDERGGASLLLRYLLDWDIGGIDVNAAPNTPELLHQKTASLDPFSEWWLDCLRAGSIVGAEFSDGNWPESIDITRFRHAFDRYCTGRRISERRPSDELMGRRLAKMAPSIERVRRRDGKERAWAYALPPLSEARIQWSRHIGHDVKWMEND